MAEQALSDVKVIDLTHYIAGPYCTKLMSGLGAEVIKIEKPGAGDPARSAGPFQNDSPSLENSGLFLYLNTGKKSVTLNLKTDSGRKIFKEMIRDADVLVESFSPRVMPSLGLDYETLAKINPRLVMTSISNFGQTGPYRDYKADELTILAISGLMHITGEPDREPIKTGGSLGQYAAGQTGFVGTMTALMYAADTGEGQHVDVSIMEANADLLENALAAYSYSGTVPRKRAGNQHSNHPWGIYPCRDGHVSFIAGPPRNWPKIVDLVGNPELGSPEFATMPQRREKRAEIDALLLPWLMEHDKVDIFLSGQAIGFAIGYVATMEDMAHSHQLIARDNLIEIEHPATGTVSYIGGPFKMTETPWQYERAPLLGEHNEEVLCERLSYTKEDLVKLRERGII